MPDTGLFVFNPPGCDWEEWTARHGKLLADIVMVHGLNGGRLSTWTCDDICWPRDLLYNRVPRVRVMTYGYDARVIFSSDTSRIRDYSLGLLTDLRDKRETEDERQRALIFVCHSLGGIVVKQALITATLGSGYQDLSNCTTGIIFFGTPHRGSSAASLGKAVSRIVGFAATRPYLLRSLNRDADVLQEITESFVHIVSKYKIKSFYELDKLYHVKLIVPKSSATMGVSEEEAIPMKGNHRVICRFSSDDSRFDAVWKAILRLITPEPLVRRSTPGDAGHQGFPEPQRIDTTRRFIESLPQFDIPGFLRLRESAQEGTCDWITNHTTFQDWLTADSTHVLHIVGEPGSGKSTAAAWLFRTRSAWCPERQSAIFSFQLGQEAANASAAWASLLSQLLGEHVGRRRWEADPLLAQTLTHDGLGGVFQTASTNIPMLYILDALDECDETVLDFLKSLATVVERGLRSPPKFLLLSRHILLSQIDDCFKSQGGTKRIHMNAELSHVENVQRYIERQVDELCIRRPPLSVLREEIVRELRQRSAGVYLLPSLTVGSLGRVRVSAGDVREILRQLPDNLRTIYSNALGKVAWNCREQVATLLLWVLFAVRPMRASELSAAMEIQAGIGPSTGFKDFEDNVNLDILNTDGISPLVGSLVEATADEDEFVSLVHSSAREYLLALAPNEPLSREHAWLWGSVGSLSGAHGVLASECLDLIHFADQTGVLLHLAAREWSGSQTTVVKSGPRSLLEYAIENLPDHIRQCAPDRDSEIHSRFVAFLGESAGEAWIASFWRLRDSDQRYKQFSPLQMCCALGLVEGCRLLLKGRRYPTSRLPDVQAVRSSKQMATELLSAVDIAAMFGSTSVLKLLTENHGVPVESDELIPQTAWKEGFPGHFVFVAAWSDRRPAPGTVHEDILRERDRAMQQLTWYRPLHTATAYGQVGAVKYLVSKNSRLSLEDQDGKYPIELAMDNKIGVLIPLLLEHHIQTDFPALAFRFLQPARLAYLEGLAKLRADLLVDGVALHGAFGKLRASLLHVAAIEGNTEAFDSLLRLGGRRDIRDSAGRQCIHYAASAGQAAFVRYLLAQEPTTRREGSVDGEALFYAMAGASFVNLTWTEIGQSEETMDALLGRDPERDFFLARSALDFLTNFKATDLSWDCQKFWERASLEKSVKRLLSKVPGMEVSKVPGMGVSKVLGMEDNNCFLHKAFASAFFPLPVALDMLGCDPNGTDSRGRTALHAAATGNRRWGESHRELAKRISNINFRDHEGMTPLHIVVSSARAAEGDLENRVRMLTEAGADMRAADNHGETPILTFARQLLSHLDGHLSVIPDGVLELMLSKEPGLAEVIPDNVLAELAPFLFRSRHRKDARKLLSVISPRQQQTWIDHGIVACPVPADLVVAALDLGWPSVELDVMVRHHLEEGQLDQLFSVCIERCLEPLARACGSLVQGETWRDLGESRKILGDDAAFGKLERIKFFLELMGGSVDVEDNSGQTLLSLAAENGHEPLTKYLLSRGASPSVPDKKGRTAVYWAAREGKAATLEALVEAGAPVTEMDVEICEQMKRERLAEYLRRHLTTGSQ